MNFNNKKHLFSRLLFLILFYAPLGILMFLGKPNRLKGLLFDIENFIGLKSFVIIVFFSAYLLIGFETLRLLLKKKKPEYFSNLLLLLFFGVLCFYSIQNDIFYKKEKGIPTIVKHSTLLVSTEGSIYNFNIETNKISWEYTSKADSNGNRNFFALEGQNIFIPFESGKLVNLDISTGNLIWKQQIYGRENGGMDIAVDNAGNDIIHIDELTPLFMSKPLIDKQNIVIASHGHPRRTTPYLYTFDKKTGHTIWKKSLPTHFNLFPPLKYKCYPYNYYFVNSAVFLEKYGSKTGSRYSYGMFEGGNEENHFKNPIYAQMQTDGRSIFIGDEKGKFYSLPLNENAQVTKSLGIKNSTNTFIKNPSVFNWIFNDETFTFQANKITFLENNVLYTVVKNGLATKSAIFAINTKNGILKWKKIVNDNILNWTLTKGKIIGNTSKSIFYLEEGIYKEVNIRNKPLSNIELLDKDHFIYITQKGIEVFNVTTQKTEVIFAKKFNDNSYNEAQIKYISK